MAKKSHRLVVIETPYGTMRVGVYSESDEEARVHAQFEAMHAISTKDRAKMEVRRLG